MASDDILLFHATLQMSALDLETVNGKNELTKSKSLLSRECISLLRERLQDEQLGTSDGTIAAVLFLAIVEVTTTSSN